MAEIVKTQCYMLYILLAYRTVSYILVRLAFQRTMYKGVQLEKVYTCQNLTVSQSSFRWVKCLFLYLLIC